MSGRLILLAAVLTLGACGSDEEGGSGPPTLSTPPPPVALPLNGAYDLVVEPAAACGFADTPYVVRVNVTTFATSNGNELRGTLPSGGDTLTLDMLYPTTGQVSGALSTRDFVWLAGAGWLFLRDQGTGIVSLAASGRAEILDGVMAGDVSYSPDGLDVLTCSSADHSWSLVAV